MELWLEQTVRGVFPTQLKSLAINPIVFGGVVGNIGDLALESFKNHGRRMTLEDLEKLPKTLREIHGVFEPESLRDRLGEFFPQLEQPNSGPRSGLSRLKFLTQGAM